MRALAKRVVGAVASWALENGQAADGADRDALGDELTALVLTQRATFATPVWLNAGLSKRPLTSACVSWRPRTRSRSCWTGTRARG